MSQPCRICENGGMLEPASLTCRCDPYYKGDCCQDMVTCHDRPCKHGTCTNIGVTFTCNCDTGYKGVVCDTHVVTCGDDPCKHGTCTDTGVSFTCNCDIGYTGVVCDTPLTCTDNPCLHDGKCIDPGTGFQCTCPNTHKGNVCEIALISEKTSQLLLPEWLPSLEYGILSIVSVIGLMTTGCVCLKCCKALGVMDERRDEDTDDEDEEENFRKTRKNVTFPDEYVKTKSKWMDF
ncbi:fibropellin-1-like [Saccostrea echinata]|uniref:fibropellin-1-like n=1 Tax=Saccostrea echinata TaxID=191078 RepID=UPI002A8208DA|nr:fibropellin-1-like [Saccostrea echinata]